MTAVKAVIMEKKGDAIGLTVKEFPEPVLEPGAVMLKTLYSEVCGTDVHLLKGQLAGVPYPIIPGHINVGAIEKINGTVCDLEGHSFQIGDEVVFLDVHETCYSCWYCLVARASTRCPSRKVYGVTYFEVLSTRRRRFRHQRCRGLASVQGGNCSRWLILLTIV